jgi:catechol-2,3-dioxygenase
MAAFVELPTDEVEFVRGSVFIRVIRGRIQGDGDSLSLRFLMFTPEKEFRPIDPQVRIGHVHLKVSDLERSLEFYCGVLGFELMQRWGTQAAFISAGGYHHHIGLNTWDVSAVLHRRLAAPVCFTLLFFIPIERGSATRSGACSRPGFRWKARVITE